MSAKRKQPKKRRSSTGKEYERIVAAIHRQFGVGAVVTENEFINGRQIDVAVRTRVIGCDILIIVECKDYSRKVEIGKVDEIIGKMQDTKAALAILVSDSGFTKGAIDRAKLHGQIYLTSVIDTNHNELKSRIKIQVRIRKHEMNHVSVKLVARPEYPSEVVRQTAFYEKLNENFLMYIAWAAEFLSEVDEGVNVYSYEFNYEGFFFRLDCLFVKKLRFYQRDIDFLGKGIFDHIKGEITSSNELTAQFEYVPGAADAPHWREISKEQAAIYDPLLTFDETSSLSMDSARLMVEDARSAIANSTTNLHEC